MRARLSGPAAPLLGAAVGLLAAVVVTVLQDSTYRADASIVLVRQGQPPGSDPALAEGARTAADLFDSRAVAASAIENLGLSETPDELVDRLDVESKAGSSLVRIEVEAASREDARRTAQEAAEVSTVLFNDRFGPQTNASVWEPATAEELPQDWARNLALGALAGALAGWVPLLLGGRRPRPIRVEKPPQVTTPPAAAAPPAAQPAPPAEPATGPFVLPGFGEWTVGDVERLLAEQGDAFPERREELQIYLDALRSVADADGRLHGDVDLVIEDVFGELIARSGSIRRS